MEDNDMPELTMDQIDKMLEMKMGFMEREYERCKKYDNVCNIDTNPDAIELKGTFDQEVVGNVKFEDKKQEIQSQNQNQENQEKQSPQNNKEELQKDEIQNGQKNIINSQIDENKQQETNQNTLQNQENLEEDNDNEDIEQQGYEQINSDGDDNNDDDNQWGEMQTAEIDFSSQPPSEDPRNKKIDVEKIKFYMSQFQLKEPEWAQDPNQLRKKLEEFSKVKK